MVDIGHNHFIYGNKKEIEAYKAIREAGVPVKSVTILQPGETAPEKTPEEKAAEQKAEEVKLSSEILEHPIHDTGSKWLAILSFFLPLLGLIGAVIYRKRNYIRNYKACKKGAVIGFITLGVILAIFVLLIALAMR